MRLLAVSAALFIWTVALASRRIHSKPLSEIPTKPINTFVGTENEQLIEDDHFQSNEQSVEIETYQSEALYQAYLELIIDNNNKIGIPFLEKSRILLDDIYVELRGRTSDIFNPSINYDTLPVVERETQESPILKGLTEAQKARLLWNSIQKPVDVEERILPKLFQKNTDKTVTLGDAFRTERRLVILGEPGSGKTTLLKWLAVMLSESYAKEGERINLSSARINPDLDDETQMDDLGFKRIPIFIRVASFNEWRKGKPNNQSSLDDYIGYHLALSAEDSTVIAPSGKTIHLSVLHDWLTQLIKDKKTVLLLDGLDEINDVTERTAIVSGIDRYLDKRYLSHTTPKLSLSEASRKDWPVDSGGNQVVITSRVAGYQAIHLNPLARHLTIEPMSEKAIKRFCQKYVLEARRTAVTLSDWDNSVSIKAHLEAEQFLQNITQLREKQVYDLTSNPIQLSILAALYLKNNAQLPGQRTELYQATIEEFLKHWDERLGRPPSTSQHTETLKVLSQIAAQMLDNSSLGYIRDDELEDALIRGGIEKQHVDGMLKLASEGVGLLSQRAPRVFSFLHLTFQEYLAGSWLLAQASPAEAILSHIDSARWREALLMALGQQALLSAHNADDKLEQLVTRLLAARHSVRGITPILLIASALREIPKLSAAIIDDLALAIILAYQELSPYKRQTLPLGQLETAFCQLCEACRAWADSDEKLQDLVLSVLASAAHTNKGKALACVRLVTAARYYSEDNALAIEQLLPFDEETLSWPVDKALSDIAGAAPECLPSAEGSLRYAVTEENTEWLVVIEQNPAWRGLCLMLYGGLDACVAEKIAANKTALNEAKRKVDENTNKPDSPAKEQLTKTLEEQKTALEAEQTRLNAGRNHFSARRLHRDAAVVTPFVISALRLGLSAESMVQPLLSAYQNLSLTVSQRAEVVVALFALDQPITPYLQTNTKLQTEVLAIFSRVNFALTQAIQSAAKSSSKALEALANQLPETDWLEIITEIIEINHLYGGKPLTMIELLNHATDVSRAQLMAEQWQYFLTGPRNDRLYNMAVVLDTVGNKLAADKLGLAYAFCAAYSAATQYGQEHLAWVNDKLARKPRSDRQTYRMALEAIIAIPQPLQFVRGWAIAMLAPEFLKDDLLSAQAIRTARCYVPDQFNARLDALQALGLLSDDGLSIAMVNKTLKRNAHLLPEPMDSELAVSWQAVTDELENLPAVLLKNTLNLPDEATLDTLFAAEYAMRFSQSTGITADILLPLIKAIPQTNDPENSVLLLARLAFYLPISVASAAVCTALKIVDWLQDATLKVRLINSLSGIAHCFPEARVLHDQALNQFADATHRQKASGYTGIYLKQEQASLNQWITNAQGLEEQLGDFTPLKLGAYIYNVKRELGYVDSIDEFWADLARQCTRLTGATQTVSDTHWAILHRLAQLKPIRLTRQAALSMELVRNHSAADFLTAIKQVEEPCPETLPILTRWQSVLDDTVRPYCSLLLAELGVIKPATVSDLLGLLTTAPEDRLRYRIAIIFYVPNLRKESRFRVSQLGAASVEALAMQVKVERKADIRQALHWSFQHIVHDDGEALQA